MKKHRQIVKRESDGKEFDIYLMPRKVFKTKDKVEGKVIDEEKAKIYVCYGVCYKLNGFYAV